MTALTIAPTTTLSEHRGSWFAVSMINYAPTFALPRHRHADFCTQTVLSGVFSERGWKHKSSFLAGETLLRPRGFEHANDASGQSAAALFVRLTGPAPHAALQEAVLRCCPISSADQRLAALAGSIGRELRQQDDLSVNAIEALTVEYLIRLLRLSRRLRGGHDEARIAEQCAKLISARLGSPLCVDALALELGVSRFTLNRAFQRSFGVGVSAYIRGARVRLASTQIAQTNRPLAAIASAAGFADQSHMTRCFQRVLGVTPRRVRSGETSAVHVHACSTPLK